MAKRIALGLLALVVLVVLGGVLLVRSLIDPEHVRQTLERQASAALGQPVAIGTAEPSFWPRAGVTLTQVVIGDPAALTLEETSISTSMRALWSRRIEDAEVVVRDSALDLPLLLAALDRLTRPSAAPAGAAPPAEGAGLTLVNVRRIVLEDVRIAAGSRTAVFNLQSSLDGDRLTIDQASVASDVTTLSATGVVESLSGRQGRLAVAAESLDLDGLIVFAQELASTVPAQAGGETATAEPALDLVLDLTAATGRAAGATFTNLAATARMTPGRLVFEPFAFGLFGGRLEGTLTVDTAAAEPRLAVSGSMSGVDMVQLTAFAGQSGSITGTMSGNVNVAGSGVEPERALASARGDGRISIANGTVRGLQLVRSIVLAFGKPDAAQPVEGGESFTKLEAALALREGVLTLSDITFASPDVDLAGAGTLTLAGSRLDLEAQARLSKALTAQAGRDLVRYTADDGRVTIPATVGGTLEQPAVGVDVSRLAQRAVTNEIKRRTETAIRDLFGRKKK